jgi:hypothetical protein
MSTASEPAPEDLPARRYVPWYRRWLPSRRTVAVVAILVLSTPVVIRNYRLWRMPDVPVPFDLDAFFALPEDIEDNANFFFEQAEAQHDPRGFTDTLFVQWHENGGAISWEDVPASARAWAEQERPALERYRRAAQCPTCVMLSPKKYYHICSAPSATFHRDFVQVVIIEALRLMNEGDTNGAAELLHDAFRATRHAGNRAGDHGRGIGAIGHYYLTPAWHVWSRHPDVTAEQLTTALGRLLRDWELTPPPSDQLKIEYATLVNEAKPPQKLLNRTFDHLLDDYCVREMELSTRGIARTMNGAIPGWQRPILWCIGEPELSLRAARLYITHEMRTCDLPLAQQPPRFTDGAQLRQADVVIGGLTASELNQRIDSAMFTEMFFRRFNNDYGYEAAHQILLETELRLQMLYREQNCTSRDQAKPLLATFEWPVDPTDPQGGVVRHRSSDEGIRIWCVGPNGVDDQGEFPKRENHGDIVVIIPWPVERE